MTDENLEKIGAVFGEKIVDLVRTNRAFTVEVVEVTDELAYVTMIGKTGKLPIPLSGMSISDTMFTIKPNVGSLAIVSLANGANNAPFFVAMAEMDSFTFKRGATEFKWEITPPERDDEGEPIDGKTNDEITLAVGETTVKVNKDVWEFNGGELGSMMILQKTVDKLNALEDGYNALVAKYNAHIHITTATVGATAVPGVIAPTTSVETTVLVPTQPTEIENEKITQ